jgi:hypothetical protein
MAGDPLEILRRGVEMQVDAAQAQRDATDAMRAANAAGRRMDAYLADRREAERREVEQDERTRAEVWRQDNLARQVQYDEDIFSRYGERAPSPAAGQSSGSFARQLMKLVL